MDTSSKGEESSSSKDTNKDKKNEESKEPELVTIAVLQLLSVYDCLLMSYCRYNGGHKNTLCHTTINWVIVETTHFHTSDSPVCKCGLDRESAEHFLLHCNRFQEARNRLKDTILEISDSLAQKSVMFV